MKDLNFLEAFSLVLGALITLAGLTLGWLAFVRQH